MSEKFHLGQDFVTRATSEDAAESPSVIGTPSPIPKEVWRAIYIATMVKTGSVDEAAAADCYDSGIDSHDFTDDPEMAAISDMEYWDDDGDAP